MGLDLNIYDATEPETPKEIDVNNLEQEIVKPLEKVPALECSLFAVEVDVAKLVEAGVKTLHIVVWE